jgi:hypothetical protein
MSPVWPPPPALIATRVHVHIIGNADEPKLQGSSPKRSATIWSVKRMDAVSISVRARPWRAGSPKAVSSSDGVSVPAFSAKSSISVVSAEPRLHATLPVRPPTLLGGVHWGLLWCIHMMKRAKESHTVVQSFCTPALLTACLYRRARIRRQRTGSRLMTRTARFRAQQLRRRSLASASLFLTIGPYVSLTAASASTQLSAVGPAMLPPQGILREQSSRSVRRK